MGIQSFCKNFFFSSSVVFCKIGVSGLSADVHPSSKSDLRGIMGALRHHLTGCKYSLLTFAMSHVPLLSDLSHRITKLLVMPGLSFYLLYKTGGCEFPIY